MVATGEDRAATVWVDTNTMLEVFSHGDIFDAEDRGDLAVVEQRRLRMQGALWMAMALCRQLVRSDTFQGENDRNVTRLGPPGSGRGWWTAAILYVLHDGGVFAGWDARMVDEGTGLSNRARDRFMVERCRDHGLILVSRDREVLEMAAIERVDASTPEAYAARVLDRDAARATFMERLRAACDWYPTTFAPAERGDRCEYAAELFELYRRVWLPAGSFVI